MTLHDPDSKNALLKDPNSLDNSQLIDDEYYEDEDDVEMEDTSVSIVTESGELLDHTGDGGTIAIAIDPQTQQLINSGNQDVMFVVQYPNADAETSSVSNGQPTLVAVNTPSSSTPRIIARGGRVTRSAAKAGGKFMCIASYWLSLQFIFLFRRSIFV